MGAGTKKQKALRTYVLAISIAVAAALLIRFFVLEAYRIPSSSMRPALEAGDIVFVVKWPFGLRMPGSLKPMEFQNPGRRAPQYGDVVVFSPPTDPTRDFIKRVIGLPGDRIEVRDRSLFVNSRSATTSVSGACATEILPNAQPYTACWDPPVLKDVPPTRVPEGHVFLISDVRSEVKEARKQKSWIIVPVYSLKAQARWTWLSLDPQNESWFPSFRLERMFKPIP